MVLEIDPITRPGESGYNAKINEVRPFLALPVLSWPTVGIFVAACLLWFGAWALALLGKMGDFPLFVVCSLACYLAFTAMHEAVHGALGRSRALNLWVGRISSSLFFSPFRAFQYLHLEHHRHTNDPALDPDYWSALSWLPIRWLTQDLFYYVVYLRDARRRPGLRATEVLAQMAILIALAAGLVITGHWRLLVWGWLLPARGVTAFLACVFNWLPHYPHDPATRRNQLAATLVRSSAWLDWPLAMQNYHLIHHLYPKVPFYRYKRIWRAGRARFLERGVHDERKLFALRSE